MKVPLALAVEEEEHLAVAADEPDAAARVDLGAGEAADLRLEHHSCERGRAARARGERVRASQPKGKSPETPRPSKRGPLPLCPNCVPKFPRSPSQHTGIKEMNVEIELDNFLYHRSQGFLFFPFSYFGKCSTGQRKFYDEAKYFYIYLYFLCKLVFHPYRNI